MSWWRGLVPVRVSHLTGKPGAGQGSPLRVAPLYRAILVNSYIRLGLVTYTTEAASLRPPTWMPCNTSGLGWRGSGGFCLRAIPRGLAGVGAVAVAAPSQQGEGVPRRGKKILALGWRSTSWWPMDSLGGAVRRWWGCGGGGGGGANHSTGAHSTSYRGADFRRSWPQVVEEILLVFKVVPQVRVSEHIVEQIFDVPVLLVVEEILEVFKVIPLELVSEFIVELVAMCPFRKSWRNSLKLCGFFSGTHPTSHR